MFDIGFTEIVLVAVVALLVVGPREFPTLIRTLGRWVGNTRRFVNSVRSEFEQEIDKADRIRQMMAKEVEIAEMHKVLDEKRAPVGRAATRPSEDSAAATGSDGVKADTPAQPASSSDGPDHGTPKT